MKPIFEIPSFLTKQEASALCAKYNRGFIYYRNPVYRFKGIDVDLEEESWLLLRMLEHRIIAKKGDIELLRVQKLSASVKVVDAFHVHTQPFSFVVFLNTLYTGGDFIYTNEMYEEKKARKRTGKLLFFTGDIPHKVTQVSTGDRFTLVAFLKRSTSEFTKNLKK